MTDLIKIQDFYLKREDLNPTGSAKDRAIPLQLQNLLKQGFNQAVISSTGNAAISAIHYCHQLHIPLNIFVSPKIDPNKLQIIKKSSAKIFVTPKPISSAIKFSQQHHAYFLRQSTDPSALQGYRQIGLEITQQLPQISSFFIPVGSGTTFLGASLSLPQSTKLFIVQPASHCPLASHFDSDFSVETHTSTTSLSAKYLPLKNKIIQQIKSHQGGGLVISEKQLQSAQQILEKQNIQTSAEGALALAGFLKAQKQKLPIGNFPLILLTGNQR
ncbi:hypothetical protein DRH14_01525 [Candidatus Shapirobacteria bacterium]|nr:MAG: hypothetical protein DRH14_01525 [Candidatus Shapirobacteria bacterium]